MTGLIVAALITGLTAGGISCFAVQGGLITGSIARQLESPSSTLPARSQNRKGKAAKRKESEALSAKQPVSQKVLAQSIGLFLLAKLVAYILLGFLLGWLGSVVSLSLAAKGIMQVLIGVFLVGNGLRMLNVHPIFRYFNFEPPQVVTRFIRRLSKNGDGKLLTPLYLGALTVLIPCGVTQSVMAVAVGTGNAFSGAAIMAAFVIGTSPAFFSVTMLAANLGRLFQKWFSPAVAVIVLLLGLYTVETGLNVMGSPYSVSNMIRTWRASQQVVEPIPTGSAVSVVYIEAQNYGYSPDLVSAPAGKPIELHLITKDTLSCSRAFAIPSLGIAELLPQTGEKIVEIPAQLPGTSIPFTCSMGMYTGVIHFQ